MLKIGLTGGIGSGKSTVAKCFEKLDIPVIDADKIARSFLKPDNIIYKKIVSHFGKEILIKKKIDQKKIGKLIFNNNKERLWLEKLLHPYICAEMDKRASSLKAPYCIMAIPLLFETKFPPKVDRVLVIDCPKQMRIVRIAKRDKHSINQIKSIIAVQTRRNERLKQADDIIHNIGTIAALDKTVKKLHNYYLSLV